MAVREVKARTWCLPLPGLIGDCPVVAAVEHGKLPLLRVTSEAAGSVCAYGSIIATKQDPIMSTRAIE